MTFRSGRRLRRGNLLDQIEFNAIGGDNGKPEFRCRKIDQRVVHAFLALMWLEVLRARKRAGDQPGKKPVFIVRRHDPTVGDCRKDRGIVLPDATPVTCGWIVVTDTGRYLRQADRRMPKQGLVDQRGNHHWQGAGQIADIDVGIGQQAQPAAFSQRRGRDEPVDRPRRKLRAPFIRLAAPQQRVKVNTQACETVRERRGSGVTPEQPDQAERGSPGPRDRVLSSIAGRSLSWRPRSGHVARGS